MKKFETIFMSLALALCLLLSACGTQPETVLDTSNVPTTEQGSEDSHYEENTFTQTFDSFSLSSIPPFSGTAYIEINGNGPYFSAEDLTSSSFEEYGALDDLGRCSVAYACIGQDLMPTEERGSIGQVKPTGWHTVKYDSVDGKYLYNRCHLIGYQLTAENANECNLITGTRYLNIEGMLPFENMTTDYIKETGNHVLYRVTPIFDGDDLVATGVLMEGFSVEDSGEGICFNVFCYNAQPGIEIDYATGESKEGAIENETISSEQQEVVLAGGEDAQTYILNTNSMKFHVPDCPSVVKISDTNRKEVVESREDLIAEGYEACGICKG